MSSSPGELPDELLSISLDADSDTGLDLNKTADSYASTAAGDIPSDVPRTFQSEAAFQAQRNSYTAKFDGRGSAYGDLLGHVPSLGGHAGSSRSRTFEDEKRGEDGNMGSDPSNAAGMSGSEKGGGGACIAINGGGVTSTTERVRLSKKEVALLGYAVGELYFDREYEGAIELIDRVRETCVVDERLGGTLDRWKGKCLVKIESKRARDRRGNGDGG